MSLLSSHPSMQLSVTVHLRFLIQIIHTHIIYCPFPAHQKTAFLKIVVYAWLLNSSGECPINMYTFRAG